MAIFQWLQRSTVRSSPRKLTIWFSQVRIGRQPFQWLAEALDKLLNQFSCPNRVLAPG